MILDDKYIGNDRVNRGRVDGASANIQQLQQQTIAPIAHAYNRPGLTEIAYRVGDYHRFRQQLLNSLSQPLLPGGPTLDNLTTRATDDGAIALLDAWAIMADVLTFYQERIANEGFLNTATERLSILELARAIGYELAPGLAASTYLSFEVEATSAVDDPTIAIPVGTQVESVPGEGEFPQLFETVGATKARPEWNGIAPRAARPQVIPRDAVHMQLRGVDTQLQPGDWLLLMEAQTPTVWQLLHLIEVTANKDTDQTLVRWQQTIDSPKPPDSIGAASSTTASQPWHQPLVFAFRQSARLFGSEAPRWADLPNQTKRQALEEAARQALEAAATSGPHPDGTNPDGSNSGDTPDSPSPPLPLSPLLFQSGVFRLETQDGSQSEQWLPLGKGLPDKDIFALAELADGTLLAGTGGSGIFRRRRGDSTWQPANEGVNQLSVLTFFVEEENSNTTVYAGTGGGGLFRSQDGGDTWVAINTGSVRVKSQGENQWASINTGLPATVVRALGKLGSYLLAGTDEGLYYEYFGAEGEQNWIQIPESKGYVIQGLQPHPTVTDRMMVGTNRGLIEVRIPAPPAASTTLAVAEARATQAIINGEITNDIREAATAAARDVATRTLEANANSTATAIDAIQNEVQDAMQDAAEAAIAAATATATAAAITAAREAVTEEAIAAAREAVIESAIAAAREAAAAAGQAIAEKTAEIQGVAIGAAMAAVTVATNADTVRRIQSAVVVAAVAATTTALEAATRVAEQVTWETINQVSQSVKTLLLVHEDRSLLVGTTTGLYQLVGDNWSKVQPDFNKSIRALALIQVGATRHLLAATPTGIDRWTTSGNDNEWMLGEPLLSLASHILTLTAGGATVYAGSRFIDLLTDVPTASSSSNAEETGGTGGGIAAGNTTESDTEEGSSAAGRLPTNLPATLQDWPNFRIQQPDHIDLDTLYPQVVSTSWAAFIDHVSGQGRGAIANIQTTQSIDRKDFSLETQITRLEIYPPLAQADQFSLRSTQIFAQSEQLPLALEPLTVEEKQHQIFQDPIWGKQIFLSQYIAHLQPQQPVLIRGKHLQAEVVSVGGVFMTDSVDSLPSSPWKATNTGLTTNDIRALGIHTGTGWLYAGTDDGVFRAIASSTETNSPNLVWQPINQGLLNTSVQALAVDDSTGNVYAGTADGIFCWQRAGNLWQTFHQGLIHPNVHALVIHNQMLYAATCIGRDVRSPRGVFKVSLTPNTRWQPTGLTNIDVQALAIKPNSSPADIFAGTPRDGIFRSSNGGTSWLALPQWENGEGLLESDDDMVYATADQSEVPLKEGNAIRASGQIVRIIEQPTRLSDGRIKFRVSFPFRPNLLPETPFSVGTNLTNPNVTALLIDGEGSDGESSDGESQTDTTVVFAGTAGSGVFRSNNGGKRWTVVREGMNKLEVRCLARELSSGKPDRLWVGTQFSGIFYSDNNGETWTPYGKQVHNTDVKAIVPTDNHLFAGGAGSLVNGAGNFAVPLHLGDQLHVVTPPKSTRPSSPDTPLTSLEEGGWWTLRDRNGFVGQLTTIAPSQLKLKPAAANDPWVSEKAEIDYPPDDQRHPILTLTHPLQYSYDPSTVTVLANIALATHGETITETLGSGDGTRSHQHFTLKQPPLTYTEADATEEEKANAGKSPTGTTGIPGVKSSLEVRVNGILWQEVAALYGHDCHDPIYFVRLDDDGSPHIHFGDGITGARLPSGLENITATYRTGLGPDGDVGAERLTLPKTVPLGVVATNNPLAATGAAPPETLQTAREKAPATLRTLDRIVSLSDFEDFARGYPGIGKTQALAVRTGNRAQWVHLTIAQQTIGNNEGFNEESSTIPDENPQENTPFYTQFVAAIDQVRDPIQQVQVNFCQVLRFNLAARVLIDPLYEQTLVMAQVKQSLQDMFVFEKRDFGQTVTDSEVIAAIQSVGGVVAVDLDALYEVGRSKIRRSRLIAKTAHWDRDLGRILPAQLLLLNATGIELEAVTEL